MYFLDTYYCIMHCVTSMPTRRMNVVSQFFAQVIYQVLCPCCHWYSFSHHSPSSCVTQCSYHATDQLLSVSLASIWHLWTPILPLSISTGALSIQGNAHPVHQPPSRSYRSVPPSLHCYHHHAQQCITVYTLTVLRGVSTVTHCKTGNTHLILQYVIIWTRSTEDCPITVFIVLLDSFKTVESQYKVLGVMLHLNLPQ